MWNALKIQGFPVLDFAGKVTTPPCGTEDGSRRKERNLRDQRTAVRFILNRTGNSKTKIPVETYSHRSLGVPRPEPLQITVKRESARSGERYLRRERMREENEDFENEARRVARALWPEARYSGAVNIDGRERAASSKPRNAFTSWKPQRPESWKRQSWMLASSWPWPPSSSAARPTRPSDVGS